MPVNSESLEAEQAYPYDIKMNRKEKIGFFFIVVVFMIVFWIGFANAQDQKHITNSTIDFLHQHGVLSQNQPNDKWNTSDIRIQPSYIYVNAKAGTLRLTYSYQAPRLTVSKMELNQPPYRVIWEKEKWKQ